MLNGGLWTMPLVMVLYWLNVIATGYLLLFVLGGVNMMSVVVGPYYPQCIWIMTWNCFILFRCDQGSDVIISQFATWWLLINRFDAAHICKSCAYLIVEKLSGKISWDYDAFYCMCVTTMSTSIVKLVHFIFQSMIFI